MRIVVDLCRNSRREHWKEGCAWFAWNFFASLLPVWLTILTLALLKNKWGLSTFTDNGELAIYSATCVAGSLYLLMKDIKHKAFPSRSALGLVALVLIVLAAATFMLVCVISTMTHAPSATPVLGVLDKDLLRVVSLWLYPLSLAFSLVVFVEDQVLIAPDIQAMAQNQLADLSKQFDTLGGTGR